MTAIEALARGRTAFAANSWAEASAHLSAADKILPLDAEDLECLATAAYMAGEDLASADARTRAHHRFLERGETIRAARSAFWMAFAILDKPGQQAQASGWLARVRRLLDDNAVECVERGFLLCALAFQNAVKGELAEAHTAFEQAARIGSQFEDRDLTALARHGQGRALLQMEKTADGFAVLDEVMVGVTCGEIAPMIAGVVYCSVISACHERFDLHRAQEWTSALSAWCASHPDMVPFRGKCLVRRSELLQLHGAWEKAVEEAQRACQQLTNPPDQPGAGEACYQQAELYRLRGEFDKADDAYRRASQAGRKPHPGLALLRLAQGQVEAADTAIRHVLAETRRLPARAEVLRGAVEIMLAAGDPIAARCAADELTAIATSLNAPFLQAAAAHALGAVALAGGDLPDAVRSLRDACTIWRQLDAPYEIARARASTGLAYRQLGDEDGAQMEFEAAGDVFERLGAVPDAARLAALLLVPAATPASGPLTGREVEVLRLIATGKTNRMIAVDLAISEKTVARHVSNIFAKLDLPSRSAATAYAYSHKLL